MLVPVFSLALFFCILFAVDASDRRKGNCSKDLTADSSSKKLSRINRCRPWRDETSEEGQASIEPSLETRAGLFFDRGGIPDEKVMSERYYYQEKMFERILSETRAEMNWEHPTGDYTEDMLKERFISKVYSLHHEEVLMKGVERYKREHGLEMTLEEFDAARNHLLNQYPPQGNTAQEKQSIASLKGYYRRQLMRKGANRQRLLRRMAKWGFTEENIKPYTFQSVAQLRDFLDRYRAERGQEGCSYQPIAQGRSNEDTDATSNHSEFQMEDSEPSLGLKLYDINISQGEETHHDDSRQEEDEDDMPYKTRYHNPLS